MVAAARLFVVAVLVAGCGSSSNGDDGAGDAGVDGMVACDGTPTACAAQWEQNASDQFDAVLGNPTALAAFLKAVPKGGDLHNHLSGAVYAETYLDWAKTDGLTASTAPASPRSLACSAIHDAGADLGQRSTIRSCAPGRCRTSSTGAQTGHDHFFATFGKFGAVAGAHRDETIADVADARRGREPALRRDDVQPRQERRHARRLAVVGHADRGRPPGALRRAARECGLRRGAHQRRQRRQRREHALPDGARLQRRQPARRVRCRRAVHRAGLAHRRPGCRSSASS